MDDDRPGVPEHEQKGGGRRRVWIVGTLLAVVLLVVAAVVLASALQGEPESVPSVTRSPLPSPTRTPTPTPTVVVPPAEGVRAFGGECSAALTDEEVSAALGRQVRRADRRWEIGETAVIGGLDCVWTSTDVYQGVVVSVYAYPASILPLPDPEVAPACEDKEIEGGETHLLCRAAAAVQGTWLYLEVAMDKSIGESAFVSLWDLVTPRAAEYPPAVAATRNDAWWDVPDCAELAQAVDASAFGYRAVEGEFSGPELTGDPHATPILMPWRAAAWATCGLRFEREPDDGRDNPYVYVRVVPGGVAAYRNASAAGSRSVVVAGASGAVDAPGNNRFEGSENWLVVTDGTNGLLLSSMWDNSSWAEEDLPLAAGVLAALQAMN